MKKSLLTLCGLLMASLLSLAQAATVGSAVLTWDALTTRSDGTPVTGTVTYTVFQGAPGAAKVAVFAKTTTGYTAAGLTPGTYCFQIKAQEANADAGPFSNEVCKTIVAIAPVGAVTLALAPS